MPHPDDVPHPRGPHCMHCRDLVNETGAPMKCDDCGAPIMSPEEWASYRERLAAYHALFTTETP